VAALQPVAGGWRRGIEAGGGRGGARRGRVGATRQAGRRTPRKRARAAASLAPFPGPRHPRRPELARETNPTTLSNPFPTPFPPPTDLLGETLDAPGQQALRAPADEQS
jgi:hypothetical protein